MDYLMPNAITTEELRRKVINEMRDEGYVIVIWSPEELGDTDVDALEDIVIERGNNFIDYSQQDDSTDF